MNAKSQQKERTHESILDSAARLMRERGISGARVLDVMKGAGLTVGGFYAHFTSKESLIDEALRRTGAELRDRLFAGIDEKPERLRAEVLLKRYLSRAHRDETHAGCALPSIVGEVSTTATEHRQVLAEQIDAFAERFEEYLPQLGTLSRRHLALGLIALLYGALSLSRAVKGTKLSDEIIDAGRALASLPLTRPAKRT